MTSKFLKLVSAILAVSLPASALAIELPRAKVESHTSPAAPCKVQPDDPFELGMRSTLGADAGKCITQDHRGVVILSDSERERLNIPFREGHVVVANIQHLDGYYIASIPLNSATEARFVLEHYIVGAGTPFAVDPGHTMMRLIFSEEVELYKQSNLDSAFAFATNDLIFSFESSTRFYPNGNTVRRIIDGSFNVTPSILTMQKKFAPNPEGNLNRVEQWRTTINGEKAAEFGARFIQLSEDQKTQKPYILHAQNCATELFILLDQMFTYTLGQWGRIIITMNGQRFPASSPKSMQARGLLDIASDRIPWQN